MKIKDIVLIRLASLNSVYKKDLILFLSDLNNNEHKTINSLIRDGYVLEREIEKEQVYQSLSSKTTKIIEITRKGRVYLSDKYDDGKYINSAVEVASKYQTTNLSKLHKLLSNNRIKLMFLKAKVLVFNKPTIEELLSSSFEKELEDGIYYSKEEFNEYINSEDKQAYDMYKSARFKGIFINREQIAMVYLSNIEKNRTIRLSTSVEYRATEIVKQTFKKLTYQKDVNALVFSNTDSLMYNMAINGHNGRNAHDNPKKMGKYIFLDNHCPFFEHIYVFSHSYSGIDSLEKYCHDDHIKYRNVSLEVFSSLKNFKTITVNNLANFYGFNIAYQEKAIYIPYYDIKQLWEIYQLDEDVSIVTFNDMAEPISHAIRKSAHFFNLEGENIFVNEYSKTGDRVAKEISVSSTKQYKPRVIRRSFSINKSTYDKLTEIASESYITVNKLVRTILNNYINEQ